MSGGASRAALLMAAEEVADPANLLLVQSIDEADGSRSFSDSGPLSLDVTPGGTAIPKHSTTQAKFGASSIQMKSPGSSPADGGALTVDTSSAVFNFGTGPFTMRWWAYLPNASVGANSVHQVLGGLPGEVFAVQVRSDITQVIWYPIGAALNFSLATATDAWIHYEVCRDGTILRLYIGGVQVRTYDLTTDTYDATQVDLTIGNSAKNNTLADFFDDFNIRNDCLHPDGTPFTPPGRLAA